MYERALSELGRDVDEDFFAIFARFEVKNKEFERANVIFKYGLEKIPKEKQKKLN